MKSLREYSLNIPDEQYHARPSWSHSKIAKYAMGGFASLNSLNDRVSSPSMEFGSLFDSIVTKGKKTLDDYTVLPVSVPDSEKKALDFFSTQTSVPLAELPEKLLMALCDQCQYQTRWGYEARLKHLLPYEDYYKAKCSGKKIVSKEDWDEAMEMYRNFRDDKYTSSIFGTKNTEDVEYIYQAQFEVEMTVGSHKVLFRIMPDLLVVNHKDKTIQPVDLKTSVMPGFNFWENFVKYRYDIEAESYTDVLKEIIKNTEYEDYTILPYLFTDISRSDKVPVTWSYDPSNGFSYTKNDRTYTYKGCWELLDEILNYQESNAKVPDYVTLDGPNDLISALCR